MPEGTFTGSKRESLREKEFIIVQEGKVCLYMIGEREEVHFFHS